MDWRAQFRKDRNWGIACFTLLATQVFFALNTNHTLRLSLWYFYQDILVILSEKLFAELILIFSFVVNEILRN